MEGEKITYNHLKTYKKLQCKGEPYTVQWLARSFVKDSKKAYNRILGEREGGGGDVGHRQIKRFCHSMLFRNFCVTINIENRFPIS